uniref:Uncharacterized protein n=1 Tax=Panagrolaimus davidi TaxID=227884 RepID=A0A914PLX0_9BILA
MDSSAVVSTPVFYGKCVWPDGPTKKQNWPFKESLIYYISKNPSSAKVYQKMIQSCKYSFEKNPVLVVSRLRACKDNVNSRICSNTFDECKKNKRKCCVKIDIAKVSSKIWIMNKLNVKYGPKNFTSVLCSKLYRCEINHLQIWDKVIMFDDLQLLTSSAKEIMFWRNSITYNDGKLVMLDKIIESSSNGTKFYFEFDNDDSTVNSLVKNIMKLKNLEKIEGFNLANLPESLSIEDISAFFKKYKHAIVAFFFNENISVEYKNQLDFLIDEIIESEFPNHIIQYDGQDIEKCKIMYSRFVV